MALPSPRPTIALAMIIKNEINNLPKLFASIADCFDEIHITDTGSTDGSVEWLKEQGALFSKCPVHIHHFEWVSSFCKARNYSISHITTDYWMWMDGDDVLSDRQAFINWRNAALEFNDMYFATYHYALDVAGKPIISFVRERVFKTKLGAQFEYDLHEGVMVKNEWSKEYAVAWAINHMRTVEDVVADRSRNVKIIEQMEKEGRLNSRMRFYLGKELFESSRHHECLVHLDKAMTEMDLQDHDRILSTQYASYACRVIADQLREDLKDDKHKWYKRAIAYAYEGLKIAPSRAEYYVVIGDISIILQDFLSALAAYGAAKSCLTPQMLGSPHAAPVFNFQECYGQLPQLQMAKIYFQMGKFEESEKEAKECSDKYQNKEAQALVAQLKEIRPLMNIDNNQPETDDIVISCPPQQAYPFDEKLYETQGMGGSETALIEMARLLKSKTKRNVYVYNTNDTTLVADSGVEYRPKKDLITYFSKNKPKLHIAWRHNIRATRATTYLWCHDLVTPSVDTHKNFEKIICLSQFHKNYVMAKQAVPESMIWVSRNGINPDKFKFDRPAKNHNKLVWLSSPDRGLDKAMLVCDEIRKEYPEVELHVYYGLDNLYKYGLGAMADRMKAMMAERPYVKYHGFTEQKKMAREIADAVVWIHPCNFIETFCITALEVQELGIYPVTRRLGALANTLAEAEEKGMATLLDHDCVTKEQIGAYVQATCSALSERKWEKMSFDISKFSWESVCDEWIKEMGV